MKLWLIQRPPEDLDYDQYIGFVVRAETEAAARALVAAIHGSDLWTEWYAAWDATCTPIDPDGPAEIILSSYNAG